MIGHDLARLARARHRAGLCARREIDEATRQLLDRVAPCELLQPCGRDAGSAVERACELARDGRHCVGVVPEVRRSGPFPGVHDIEILTTAITMLVSALNRPAALLERDAH